MPEQVGERLVHPRHLGLDLREQGLPGIRLGELVGQNVQSPGNAGQGNPQVVGEPSGELPYRGQPIGSDQLLWGFRASRAASLGVPR